MGPSCPQKDIPGSVRHDLTAKLTHIRLSRLLRSLFTFWRN